MNNTAHEVLDFVKENDVHFVRLAFCDLFGLQKNISILPEELPLAFESGISFDAHAVRGFGNTARSDLFLHPDAATLSVLPWRPGPGHVIRFYCDIKKPDGSPFLLDGRQLLKNTISRCEAAGYVCKIGAECEFYLFKTDENGEPTNMPLDRGGYLDISPLDKGENIRREICLCLKEMGLQPESSHHEQGPGQNEIDFKFSDALSCADNLLTFKAMVKAIAARNGLFASFLPKPLPDVAGSGMHVNLSLNRNGVNVFRGEPDARSAAGCFMAGVLHAIPEMTLFLNPLANSYDRFGKYEAPKYISWSHQNRSQLIRIPAAAGARARMELRSPDPSLNPYLSFALIIAAGLAGMEKELPLPDAVEEDLYAETKAAKMLTPLPETFAEAMCLTEQSDFVRSVLGEKLVDSYLAAKQSEADAFAAADDKAAYFKQFYFDVI